MKARILSMLLVGTQFACVAVASWPFVPWRASAFGIALASAGCVLGGWTLAFNRPGNFSVLPEVKRNARLIKGGPYAYIRHPMYSALMLLVFGIALLHFTRWSALAAVSLIAVLTIKSVVEERRLSRAFGDYGTYAARVGRFAPRLASRHRTNDAGR